MFTVTLDTGLNLLWLAISVFALARFGRSGWRRSFAVFLATVALFPIVSDSDDLFSFSLLRAPIPHHRDAGTTPEGSREQDTIQLARLIETLDHYQPVSFFEFNQSFAFVSLSLPASYQVCTRSVRVGAGRDPPLV